MRSGVSKLHCTSDHVLLTNIRNFTDFFKRRCVHTESNHKCGRPSASEIQPNEAILRESVYRELQYCNIIDTGDCIIRWMSEYKSRWWPWTLLCERWCGKVDNSYVRTDSIGAVWTNIFYNLADEELTKLYLQRGQMCGCYYVTSTHNCTASKAVYTIVRDFNYTRM